MSYDQVWWWSSGRRSSLLAQRRCKRWLWSCSSPLASGWKLSTPKTPARIRSLTALWHRKTQCHTRNHFHYRYYLTVCIYCTFLYYIMIFLLTCYFLVLFELKKGSSINNYLRRQSDCTVSEIMTQPHHRFPINVSHKNLTYLIREIWYFLKYHCIRGPSSIL